jgi:tetratricopeptide (TPR) repeat protein
MAYVGVLAAALLAAAPPDETVAGLLDRYIETENVEFLAECRSVLSSLLREQPRSYPARVLEARLLLAEHKLPEAAAAAEKLNREAPDDLDVYAILVDTYRASGRRKDAERAAQWMLDLRINDVRGLRRAAALREDSGDLSGAIDLMLQCVHQTPAADRLNRAAILADLARLYQKTGQHAHARQLAQEALRRAPSFPPAERLLRAEPESGQRDPR